MGKSASCLRIIPCGGGDPDEAVVADQTTGLKVKKGWSFRKRSSSGRAVSNSLVAETPSPGQKENRESAAVNFQAAKESVVSEESALQLEEKNPPPKAADFDARDAMIVSENDKYPPAVHLHTPNTVYVSETEKHNVTSNLDFAEAASVPEPHTADLCETDGLTVSKTEYESVLSIREPDVIIIQSAVRGFLARKEQIKHKSVVKLQAAVRGHLVRCNAVGALRCVQAIAKMQVLVRARYARLTSEETAIESNEIGNRTRKNCKPPKTYPEITYTSMTELLKNSFARQLLESSPKSKPIKIKCDPLSRDSSWVWLERWMSLASPVAVDDHTRDTEIGQEVKNIGKEEHEENFVERAQEEKITVEDYLFHEENEIFQDAKDFANSGTSGEFSKSDAIEEANTVNRGEIIKSISDKDSLSASSLEKQKSDAMGEVDIADSATRICSVNLPVNASENTQPEIVSASENSALEQAPELVERIKAEVEDEEVLQLRTEDENIVYGPSEESGVPVIIEPEIISKLTPSDSMEFYDSKLELDSVSQDIRVEEPISHFELANESLQAPVEEPTAVPKLDISVPQDDEAKELVPHSSEFDSTIETGISSGDEITINHRELSQLDNSNFQVGESECGAELSVTSTLDSPHRSEIGPVESERMDAETHVPEEPNFVKVDVKSESGSVEKEESDVVNGESAIYATATSIIKEEKEPEANASHLQLAPEAAEEKKPMTSVSDFPEESEGATERSHQASPGSQVTFSESQGTPSSQVSVSTNPKRAKSEKSGSIKKRSILSTAKRSPVTSNNDSGGKSSTEQHPKEQKSSKRRTSFGSPKPDVSDQEQRIDSSTSSSLPSYMQATLSARAKANVGHSPHSSPEVADNSDIILRKRHSLSGAKDRQDSPRLGRTPSQPQSGTKSNGTSPLERKWQR